jgi:GTP pyrophosphokinase
MKSKSITFNEVYDIRAVRVLVPELKDCYAALGIIHSLWQHIPKEFDDYIATPKRNGYRSLHTAVIGPEGKVLEVQVRTHDMHEEAEYGVCSHWRYKGSDRDKAGQSYEEKIEWLRHVLQWHEEVGDPGSFVEELQLDFEQDRIYVFTPAGHVIDLPTESTPIDFAYRVHSEVGHHCRGAKVNGHIVPLNYKLNTGERVEILTAKNVSPSRDWLNPASGYIASSRTRNKVQHWFKLENKEKNASAGHALVEQELKRLALYPVDYKKLAPLVNYKNEEDMFAAVGAGDLRIGQIVNAAQVQMEPLRHDDQLQLKLPSSQATTGLGLNFKGVDNVLSHIAGCCKPVPDDDCTGFITLGRGVSIHRSDCANIQKLQNDEPERIIEVHWLSKTAVNYPVDVIIKALDRPGLLRDITSILANDAINVTAIHSEIDEKTHAMDFQLTVEVPDLSTLGKVMGKISQLPNIIEVKRYKQGG